MIDNPANKDKFFLTSVEMRELTGYQFAHMQTAWLKRNGWVYIMAADPKKHTRQIPKVCRDYARQKLGVKLGRMPARQEEPEWEPDFTDLRNGTASI